MKRMMGVVLLASLVSFTGCELLQPKKGDQSEGEGDGASSQPADDGSGGGEGDAPPPPPAVDMSQYVKAPPMIPLGEGIKVGYGIDQQSKGPGGEMAIMWAVVGETGDSWLIEHAGPYNTPMVPDSIMGLTVNKEDGKVTAAVLGKAGEKGKEIGITEMQEQPQQEGPEAVDEDVTLKMGGPYPAKKTVTEHATSWVGASDELEGIVLKVTSEHANYELKEMPSMEDVDVGGTSVSVKKVMWDNDTEQWTTDQEVVKALVAGQFKYVAGGTTTETSGIKTDAAPQLVWE